MGDTKIEWADQTRNWQAGCTEARRADGTMDPACLHCYARLMSARLEAMGMELYWGAAVRRRGGATWTGALRWSPELLARHLGRLQAGKVTFAGSMTDLWHEGADPAMWAALAVAARAVSARPAAKLPRGMVTLTKRADRLLAFQREHFPEGLPTWWWPGVTVADQLGANERIPELLALKCEGPRVVSYEPAMGPIDWDPLWCHNCDSPEHVTFDPPAQPWCVECDSEAGSPDWFGVDGIGWLIAGGESGSKARPSHPDWFRAARDAATAAGVPFFFKQWGEWGDARTSGRSFAAGMSDIPEDANSGMAAVVEHAGLKHRPPVRRGEAIKWWATLPNWLEEPDDERREPAAMVRVGKRAAGRLLDGREWSEVPRG